MLQYSCLFKKQFLPETDYRLGVRLFFANLSSQPFTSVFVVTDVCRYRCRKSFKHSYGLSLGDQYLPLSARSLMFSIEAVSSSMARSLSYKHKSISTISSVLSGRRSVGVFRNIDPALRQLIGVTGHDFYVIRRSLVGSRARRRIKKWVRKKLVTSQTR